MLRIILFPILLPYYIVKVFLKGFHSLALFLSRGFYFYFQKFFSFLYRIIPLSFFKKISHYFEIEREDPYHAVLLVLFVVVSVILYDSLHVESKYLVESNVIESTVKDVEPKPTKESSPISPLLETDFNLFRIYGKYSFSDISFDKLKKTNSDTVVWLTVENTNINYPIVQQEDNDFYLNHSFDRTYSLNGWTFMDFRNHSDMSDYNTIFYGHNLFNQTSFGSIESLFHTSDNDINISVLTPERKLYIYKVFSAYLIDAEVYYLKTDFIDSNSYQKFLDVIKNRNIISVDNSVEPTDKIITLSTCTDDNMGRKVIHAKLIDVVDK